MKKVIHTTLSKEHFGWLTQEASKNNLNLNNIIELTIDFYRKNKDIPEKFVSARFFLKQLIQEELKDHIQDYHTNRIY